MPGSHARRPERRPESNRAGDGPRGGARHAHRRARRRFRWGRLVVVLALLVLLGIVALVPVAWTAYRVGKDLVAAQEQLPQLRYAVRHGDFGAAERHLRVIRTDVTAARAGTRSLAWRTGEHLPWAGEDFRVVRVAADLVSTVADRAEAVLGQGSPLSLLRPSGGRVDVAGLSRLVAPVQALSASVSAAQQRADALSTAGLAGPVRRRVDDLRSALRQLGPGLRNAARIVESAPALLGAQGRRTYLVVFESNAEIRATGGLPGSWALVSADHGAVRLLRTGSDADVGLPKPPLPISATERAIFTRRMVNRWQNFDYTPDFARSAALFRTMVQRRYPGTRIDGVFSADTVTQSYLLRAVGPLEAGGLRLTPQNVVATVLHDVYKRIPVQRQDAFFQQVAAQTFAGIVGGGADPRELMRGVLEALREGRLHFHSFVPVDLPATRPADVGVYLDAATGSKMDFFLRTRYSVRARCAGSGQQVGGTVTFRSLAARDIARTDPPYVVGLPKFGTPAGTHRIRWHLYGPPGGRASAVLRVDGRAERGNVVQDGSRQVVSKLLQFAPGSSLTVSWTVTVPGHGDVTFEHTPGMLPIPARTVVHNACG